MQGLLCATYHLEASALFKQLAESGKARLSAAGDLQSHPALAAVIELLSALAAHQQAGNDPEALLTLAETVRQYTPDVHKVLPDIAADAATALWSASRPLLESAVGSGDTGAEQAAKVTICLLMQLVSVHNHGYLMMQGHLVMQLTVLHIHGCLSSHAADVLTTMGA